MNFGSLRNLYIALISNVENFEALSVSGRFAQAVQKIDDNRRSLAGYVLFWTLFHNVVVQNQIYIKKIPF